MQNIFLSPTNVASDILLEPKENTLYVLPKETSTSITLNLSTPGVSAFIVGLFQSAEDQTITIKQNHFVPHTKSHVLLKSLIAPGKIFSYQGNIYIAKEASESTASQEARGLLLGEEARFKAMPSLEILPKSVTCNHKASSAPVNPDSLFTLNTRGFSEGEAKKLLESAFLKTALDTLHIWGVRKETILEIENNLPNSK